VVGAAVQLLIWLAEEEHLPALVRPPERSQVSAYRLTREAAQPRLRLAQRRRWLHRLLEVVTVKALHKQRRAEVLDRPQAAQDAPGAGLHEAGREPEELVRRVSYVDDARFARRQRHEATRPEVEAADDVRYRQRLVTRQVERGGEGVGSPPERSVASEVDVARVPGAGEDGRYRGLGFQERLRPEEVGDDAYLGLDGR
jgi:hypothetical protein